MVAAWGLFAVAERVYGVRAGVVAVVLWAALPVGIVTSMAYSEALFTALAAWALYATLAGRWWLAGLLATLGGLTRPTGVALVAAVVLVAAATMHRDRSVRALPALVLAPLGTLAYLAFVARRTGQALGYPHVTQGWGNGVDGGRAFAAWVAHLLTGAQWPLGALLVTGVSVLVGLLVLAVRDRMPLPLVVFAVVTVALAFTTSGYFGSKPRYLLPAFPRLLPVAVRLARPRGPSVSLLLTGLLGVLAVGSAVYGAVWLLGPGPP